jgi:transcriptional regulator with XRE-family HTH domain
MPRQNQPRSIGRERALAERIQAERRRQGVGVDALAKRMTDAGCPIRGTAIQRIEKGDPPRKISVDELFAFAQAFGMTVEDILRPKELADQERAHELIERVQQSQASMGDMATETVNVIDELFDLARDDADLGEYVANQLQARGGGKYTLEWPDEATPEGEAVAECVLLRMVKANRDHWDELRKVAGMWSAFKRGAWDDEDQRRAVALAEELRVELGTELD